MSSRAALRGLILKETFHVLRDRRTLLVVLALPVVQMLLFGYALQTDVEEIRLVVVDPAGDVRSREVVDRFRAVPEYRLVDVVRSDRSLVRRFRRGEADQAVVFEPGFAGRLPTASGASVLVVTDAASPITGLSMEGFATGVLRDWAAERAPPEAASRRGPRIEAHTRFAFNPTLESQLLFVPGLLAFILTIVSALMTAITVAREKETGTLDLLLVSPLEPGQIIQGKVVPYLGLAFLNALTTLAIAHAVFDVPVRGSVLLLLAECVLFVTVSLGLGVLIASRTPTQRTAMLGVILGTMLPTAILSGMIFPIESMPGWLRPVTHLVPAKWFIEVVRGVMLKGATLETLWTETLVLVGMAGALLAASARAFAARAG